MSGRAPLVETTGKSVFMNFILFCEKACALEYFIRLNIIILGEC